MFCAEKILRVEVETSLIIPKKTMTIPIPPIHCVMLLHKRRDFGRVEGSLITVRPVVVKPEMLSNMASIILIFVMM